MKKFDDLTKQELVKLTAEQVDAYIDITLAENNIKKPINLNIDFPEFVKSLDKYPEKDLKVYQCESLYFTDIKDAQIYSEKLSKLQQVKVDYNYSYGSENKYIGEPFFSTPDINIVKIYSKQKYETVKEQIKQINEANEKKKETVIEDTVDYDAVDKTKDNIRSKVRGAIVFFEKVKVISENYDKYFEITNNKTTALATLFKVYDVTDTETKDEVKKVLVKK